MDGIEGQLLDIDGSCRDITFWDVSAKGASRLLDVFDTSFRLESASNEDGKLRDFVEARQHIDASKSGMLHTVWQSCVLISHLQLVLLWENRQRFFAEITFFPQDIDHKLFSLDRFFQFLQPVVKAVGVEQFYVRYENASWAFGDTSSTSGVILSAAEFREWANKDASFQADIQS